MWIPVRSICYMPSGLNLAVLSFCTIALFGACTPEPVEQITNNNLMETESFDSSSINDPSNEVQVRWTAYGIPHVKADSWKGLGYGFAHAVASNTICVPVSYTHLTLPTILLV